ncbi:hypothetical protein AAG570_010244 [Ranatra chinensis]|uniref:Serpin domain-containing protein n=1 Tax=Ranatra chinensis TaxID=642074 RepID=A0ABD0YM29_9HEMI
MAFKHRNMFYVNMKQETTERVKFSSENHYSWIYRSVFNYKFAFISLPQMGFKAIGADFSKATDARRMELSKVYHEANIVVDEKGTEASGVTGADIVLLSFPPAVELNRPFLFFIIDWRCSAIISMGHFVKP